MSTLSASTYEGGSGGGNALKTNSSSSASPENANDSTDAAAVAAKTNGASPSPPSSPSISPASSSSDAASSSSSSSPTTVPASSSSSPKVSSIEDPSATEHKSLPPPPSLQLQSSNPDAPQSSPSGDSAATPAAPLPTPTPTTTPATSTAAGGASTTPTAASGVAQDKAWLYSNIPPRADLLKSYPLLSEVPPSQQQALFVQKLRLCNILFEWTDAAVKTDTKFREAKRLQLNDLVDFIGSAQPILSEAIVVEVIRTVSINIFRALPPKVEMMPAEEGDEEPFQDPAWPHLVMVYELFLRFIVSGDVEARTLKKYITGPFVLKLLDLFDSQDHRERDYLKTLLHRIYAKFMSLRSFIRRSINNVFYSFLYETEEFCGVAELLEILGSIINGFALPLKAEHKAFFTRVLTPMHKVRPLQAFHKQLSYCVAQFVDKDSTLSVPLIQGLLKCWPVTCAAKEVMFLSELEEILELIKVDDFTQLIDPLFKQIAKSISSPHFQVAERAFYLWQNDYIHNIIMEHRNQIFPLLYPAFLANDSHWSPNVVQLSHNVLKFFTDADMDLVTRVIRQYQSEKPSLTSARQARRDSWVKVDADTAAAVAQFPPPPPVDPADKLPPKLPYS